MARLDIGLAEAITAASPAQRLIACWAARRAYEVAGIAGIVWIEPALQALDHRQPRPPPFHAEKQVWQLLLSDQQVPRTTVVSIDGQVPNLMRAAAAVPALFAAAGPDPLIAALQALYHAAIAFGRDDYSARLEEVRSAFSL